MSIWDDEKPDPDAVMRLKAYYESQWGQARAQWGLALSFYNQERPIWLDEDGKLISGAGNRAKFHPSTATSIIDHASDQHFSHSPKVHCYPAGEGDEHSEKAGQKEKWATAVLNDCAAKVPYLLFRQVVKQLNVYGYTPAEVRISLDDLPTKPEEPEQGNDSEETYKRKQKSYKARQSVYNNKRLNFNPFRIEVPSPFLVLMDPWDLEPKCVIKVMQIEKTKLRDLAVTKQIEQLRGASREVYRVPDVDEKDEYKPVEAVELWTPKVHVVYEGGSSEKPVFTEKNPWGFIPDVHAYSGNGMEYSGYKQDRNPSQLCVSLLSPIFDELIMNAMKVNATHDAVMDDAYPQLMAQTDESALDLVVSKAAGGVGVAKKEEAWFNARPPMAAFSENAQQEGMRRIETATFNLLQAGFKEAGVDTATGQMIRSNAAGKKSIAVTRQLEQIATALMQRIFKLAEYLFDEGVLESITVRGVTLTADILDGITDCAVTFAGIDPVVEQQLKQVALGEVQAGLMTEKEFYEKFGGEDWTGHQDQKTREMLQKHPYSLTFAASKIAKADGDNELADSLEAKLKVLREGLVQEIAVMKDPMAAQKAKQAPKQGGVPVGGGM